MYLKRGSRIKYFIAAIVGAALYCEWFIYVLQPLFWQRLECEGHDASCTKVLFIADPKIQGDLAVAPPFSYLYNWDSDRYLKSTFSVVLKHFKPDIVVFMGDLMDEGSIATLPQFHQYVKRLSRIFDIDYPVVQIWLPGDNDIGDENEPLRREKLLEFEKISDQPSVITFQNTTFNRVNGIIYTFPKKIDTEDINLKVVVSHHPLPSKTVNKVIKKLNPDIFFCAHDHKSMYVKQNKDLTHSQKHELAYGDAVLKIPSNNENLYEIYVPTCSYRVGTSKMGYGAAILDKHNLHMQYTVFWSPTRFPYLFFYLTVLILFIGYFLIFCAARLFHKHPKIEQNSIDKQPLLERIWFKINCKCSISISK